MQSRSWTRRGMLEASLALGAASLASSTGCAGPMRSTPHAGYVQSPVTSEGGLVAYSASETRDARALCEHLVPKVSDMSWLSRGDSVFVKVACNSPYRHPAVTSPHAVAALVGFLRDRGAGKIYVGDQAGVEHVRLLRDRRVRSTRHLMQENGLLGAIERAGAVLHNFDDHGWDSYAAVDLDFENHWGGRLFLPRILERVDHVVVLSRLGSHALAGYSAAMKNAVGWLRDDSRQLLHRQGESFFEKIAEINHSKPLRDKLRLALTLGDKALLEIGPDIGGEYDFASCMGIASRSLVDHDAFAAALLSYLEARHVSIFSAYSPYPEHVNFWNKRFVEEMWGEQAASAYAPIETFPRGRGIAYDTGLARLALLQGYHPARIVVRTSGTWLEPDLRDHLARSGEGLWLLNAGA